MCVATNASDSFESEIEKFGFEAGLGEEGDKEGAEAAVDVEGDFALGGEGGEECDWVDNAVWKVWG